MPTAQEHALMKVANRLIRKHLLHRKKGETRKEARNAFVYGIMRKDGWRPKRRGGPR